MGALDGGYLSDVLLADSLRYQAFLLAEFGRGHHPGTLSCMRTFPRRVENNLIVSKKFTDLVFQYLQI